MASDSPGSDSSGANTSSEVESIPQKAQAKVFHFVDPSDKKSARVHVMRHHLQEKKKLQTKRLESNLHSGRIGGSALPWRKKQSNLQQPSHLKPKSSHLNEHQPLTEQALLPYDPVRGIMHRVPSPRTMLSAARKDPFETLSLRLNDEEHDLVDCWNTTLRCPSGQQADTYMVDNVFQYAIRHPLTLQSTILTYCARFRAQCFGFTETPQSQHHKALTAQRLSEYLAVASNPNDNNVAMVLISMAIQDELFGKREVAHGQMAVIQRMMRERPGWHKLPEVYLHFSCYIMVPHPQRGQIGTTQYTLLREFLRDVEWLSFEQSTASFKSQVSQRHNLFYPGSSLHNMLARQPSSTDGVDDKRFNATDDAPASMQDLCRTACLIYINAALWDHRNSYEKTAKYLDYLAAVVNQHSLDRSPSPQLLTWLLIEDNASDPHMRNHERAFLVDEILKIAKNLRRSLQIWFDETLLEFLMLRAVIPGVLEWESEIRFDLLGR